MNAIEEYEIYKAYKNKKTEVILNDQLNFQSNILYDTAIRIQNKVHSAPVSYTHLDVYKRQFIYDNLEILFIN